VDNMIFGKNEVNTLSKASLFNVYIIFLDSSG